MYYDLIKKIADNLQDLNYSGRISPFGINEPLLDNRLLDIIRLFRSKCPKSFISVESNGDLLTKNIYKSLVEAGMNALGLSIYDDQRWQELRHFTLYHNVTFIDMRGNNNLFENRGGEIKQIKHQPLIDTICLRPTNMLVIRPKGQVVICCADMYNDVVLGDVNTQCLEDIWYSDDFNHYRKQLAASGRIGLKLCETCSHGGRTSYMKYPIHNIDSITMKYLKYWIPESMRASLKTWVPDAVKKILK